MSKNLVIYINGMRRLEFDRGQGVPGQQRKLLDEMDLDMDNGIQLGDERIEAPDAQQKAQYVIEHLLNALARQQEQAAVVFCTYLGVRLPELLEIRAVDQGGGFSADLQFA